MESIRNLLILYAGVLLLNTILSLMLWTRSRNRLHRAVLLLWGSSLVTFVTQGALNKGDIQIIVGFSFVFLITMSLANLLASLIDEKIPWRMLSVVMLIGLGSSILLSYVGLPFYISAVPVSFAGSFPAIYTIVVHYIRRYKGLTFTARGLLISTVFYIVHTLDYPFLRLDDSFAAIGFTIATLILFALSIFAPAVVLEIVTQKEARNTAEMDVARQIQTNILPPNPKIEGYDLVCYMKPADEVGGDYYDIFSIGDFTWVLLGDVTGHGLRSGLVMLMAQSIIRAIVQTRNDISPTELNTLANQVLFDNLQRLNEHRTMTIVAFSRREDKDQFAFSGTHDNIYVWRSREQRVDVVEVGHFPCGLGLIEDVEGLIQPETFVNLHPGDLLFLGTDGITEAAQEGDYKKGIFDEARLVAFLKANGDKPLSELKKRLIHIVTEFTNGVFFDDVTFVMIRKTAN